LLRVRTPLITQISINDYADFSHSQSISNLCNRSLIGVIKIFGERREGWNED
jgi:hypothetical protein